LRILTPRTAAAKEALLLSGTRQLTFEGRRAGEGYFSKDGSQLVFQSEREAGNPFFQIYLMDRATGDIQRVSSGRGKTTCAWIHPDGDKVLFASTHDDESAANKQRSEIELRKSGKERRYSWDYDEHFEIYEFNRKTHKYRRLTNARGYDAEGSWSPDGKLIAFTSNRRAYHGGLNETEKKQFELDPANLNDIYIEIVELAGKKIENIYDYTHAIEGLKVGEPVKIVVIRNSKHVELKIVPASRD
jgi:Tol biopolymer transport system component